jgi:hypothetical protein
LGVFADARFGFASGARAVTLADGSVFLVFVARLGVVALAGAAASVAGFFRGGTVAAPVAIELQARTDTIGFLGSTVR